MKFSTHIALTVSICAALFTGCAKKIDEQSIVGYWKISPESVEAMLREQAGDAEIDEETLGKQIARHFMSKMVIEFTATEFNQYRGGRSGRAAPYTVISVADGTIELNLADKAELSIEATHETLSFAFPGSKDASTWQRLSEEEVATLKQKIDEIENGPSATAKTEQRFMWIINAPQEKAEAYLKKYPDLIEARTETEQQTLLHYSARFEKEALMKLALESGADVKAEDESKETALYMLATDSDFNEPLIQLLLEAGANIDHKSDWGETPFHRAVSREKLENAKALLKLGAAVDGGVEIGKKTPLFEAIEGDQTEIVKFLIENGANINHTTSDSKDSTLYVAARYGSLETIQLLLDAGMDPNAGNADDWKPISNIAFRDEQKIEAVKLLVAAGADINERGAGGMTLLSGAIWRTDTEFCKQLIEAGADFELETEHGNSHYEKAKNEGMTELVEFMDEQRKAGEE